MAGGIGCVDDASMAMAAFACQVEAEFGLLIARERHAVADQPFNGRAPVLDDVAGSRFIAQSCASDERVVEGLHQTGRLNNLVLGSGCNRAV